MDISSTVSSMARIDSIVRHTDFTDPAWLASLSQNLRGFAASDGHELGWVLKKAHDTIASVLWAGIHSPLNTELGFDPGYTG